MQSDMPQWLKAARDQWRWQGRERPPFAAVPEAGQESVWDYPRPPAIVADSREVTVQWGPIELARTRRSVRVLETAHPPSFYLPLQDVRAKFLDCRVDGMRVRPQPGGFYGGWITPELVGPFKGERGSEGW